MPRGPSLFFQFSLNRFVSNNCLESTLLVLMYTKLSSTRCVSQVLVDSPDMVRAVHSMRRLALTALKVDVERMPKKTALVKALQDAGACMEHNSHSCYLSAPLLPLFLGIRNSTMLPDLIQVSSSALYSVAYVNMWLNAIVCVLGAPLAFQQH